MPDAYTALRAASKSPRRLYWLQGHPTIVHATHRTLLRLLKVPEYARTQVGAKDAHNLTQALTEYGLSDTDSTVVTITDAHDLTDHHLIKAWLDKAPSNQHVIALSGYQTWNPPEHVKGEPMHNIALREVVTGTKKASLTQCSFAYSDAGRDKLIAFSRAVWAPTLSTEQVAEVVHWCDYDPAQIREALTRLRYFPKASSKAMRAIAPPPHTKTYVESLMALQRSQAIALAPSIPTTAVHYTLAHVEQQLDLMAQVVITDPKSDPIYTQAARMGTTPAHLMRFRRLTKFYDTASLARRSALLEMAFMYRTRPGVLELVAARW